MLFTNASIKIKTFLPIMRYTIFCGTSSALPRFSPSGIAQIQASAAQKSPSLTLIIYSIRFGGRLCLAISNIH